MMAYNILLNGSKLWKFIPVEAQKNWEQFLQEKGISEVDQSEPAHIKKAVIEEWNTKYDKWAVRMAEQTAGDMFLVPPNCWHQVVVVSNTLFYWLTYRMASSHLFAWQQIQ